MAVVVVHWATLLVSKTRRLSLFTQGMRNNVLTFSLFFETALAAFLSYTPGMEIGLRMFPLKYYWWFLALPFAALLIVYDEVRKFFLRRSGPNSFVATETDY